MGIAWAAALVVALAAPSAAAAAPVVYDTAASTKSGTPVTVALHATDDFDAQISFAVASPPSHGSLGPVSAATCTFPGGMADCTATVDYTPAPGYAGPDGFTYTANDPSSSNPATVSLTVIPPLTISAEVVGQVGAPLGLSVTGAQPGATVDFGDGSGQQALAPQADGGVQVSHVYTREGTYAITVTNHGPGGERSAATTVNVLLADPLGTASGVVAPGTTGMLDIPPQSGLGLSLSLSTSPSDPSAATQVGATYAPANPLFAVAGAAGDMLAGYDVRTIGTTDGDRLTVTFRFRDTELPAPARLLFFRDGVAYPVQPSRLVPNAIVVDQANHTITVVLDGSSFPTITALTGTRFAVVRSGRPVLRLRSLKPRRLRPARDLRGTLVARLAVSQRAVVSFVVEPRGRPALVAGRGASRKTFQRTLGPGRHAVALPLRLSAGLYRLMLTARNRHGASIPRRATFTVLRPAV